MQLSYYALAPTGELMLLGACETLQVVLAAEGSIACGGQASFAGPCLLGNTASC